MLIRPYEPTDTEALMGVFRKNVPHAFGEEETADYIQFLQDMPVSYVVAEHAGQLVGACGYFIPNDGTPARLVWIFSDPNAKGLGTGSALVRYCLNAIRQQAPNRLIECRTSQVAYRFFERFGFVLHYTRPDYWVPGLDLYYMTLPPVL
ncbi:GNAT family N-acetyltransferase [Spirosoma montaniterrae]|uniref:N-acetyltransferase domain-containing protein n=1 Tax=Spirosoma montaniterrae TaxID=1178516 RepID=A0A1P9WWB7_9BACT|nr:GNAT family N-acetyltransferase [Spirosoma montaniterrae]AQG79685.1 hypothetical protein AWR27_10305 [Spirosoma montaniterrae]